MRFSWGWRNWLEWSIPDVVFVLMRLDDIRQRLCNALKSFLIYLAGLSAILDETRTPHARICTANA